MSKLQQMIDDINDENLPGDESEQMNQEDIDFLCKKIYDKGSDLEAGEIIRSSFEETNIKHDIRYDLIPSEVLKEVAIVLGQGLKKKNRGPDGWRINGENYSTILASKGRHYHNWQLGEVYDKDSGRHNLAHELCNTIFLLYYELKGMKDLDDRYRTNNDRR